MVINDISAMSRYVFGVTNIKKSQIILILAKWIYILMHD